MVTWLLAAFWKPTQTLLLRDGRGDLTLVREKGPKTGGQSQLEGIGRGAPSH